MSVSSRASTDAHEEARGGVELPACPACGTSDLPEPLVYEASFHTEGEVVGLTRCPACGVHFTRPRLVRHNWAPREARYEDIVAKYGRDAAEGTFHKNPNYRLYLRLAEERLARAGRRPPYRVLDIGSHCGFFLRFATENGWDAEGIEPAGPCVRFAREVNGVERIRQGFFDETFERGERYDLVTMFDVLEHIPDPVRLLGEVWQRLRPDGLLIAKVPHVRFYLTWWKTVRLLGTLRILPRYPTFSTPPPPERRDAKIAGFFDLFEHVVHYDETAVRAIFGKAGFQRWELLPAPPTNPPGHPLNVPRSLVYGIGRLLAAAGRRPGGLTHGLLIAAQKG